MLVFASLTVLSARAQAEPASDSGKVHHVVIIWLKQAGDEQARRQYITGSAGLAELPGVVSYDPGTPANVKRSHINPAIDESYDVAVSSVFESREAYEAFLTHPEYLRVAQQVLRPLVERYKVFDFIEGPED